MNFSIFQKRCHFLYCISLIILLLSFSAFCQENIIFERLNTSNGLSNNNAKIIFQDSKGYLWIGTNDGLNKYDGYKFTIYRHDAEDTTSLSDNEIWEIYEDNNNDIWIGTKNGLNRYNRDRENFTTFNLMAATAEYRNAFISLLQDHKGNFWMGVGYEKGLTKFDPATKKFTHFAIDSFGTNNTNVLFDIIEDQDEKGLWLGCFSSGLAYFDFKTETITKYKNDPNNPASLSNNLVWDIVQDNDGDIWVATEGGGLDRFNPAKKEFTHYKNDPENPASLSSNFVQSIFIDPDNKDLLWIATRGGLNIFDKQQNVFPKQYKSDVNDYTTLSNDFVWNAYKDRSGTFWIGTQGGLDKVDPGRVPFKQYSHSPGKKNGLSNNMIWSMTSFDNNDILWIGTSNGLNKFDRKNNIFSNIKHIKGNANSLSCDTVLSVYQDPDEAGEVLWLGTWGGGLNRFDLKNNQFKSYKFNADDPASVSSNIIRKIYETRDGTLWLTTNRGLNKFDRKRETFTTYAFQDTIYIASVQNLLNKLVEEKKPLAAILKVGEMADLEKSFKLTKKTTILIASVGEGRQQMFDYGWLETQSGEKIWTFKFDKSRHAGGGDKNRMQLGTLTLQAGQYKLRYVSDTGHSYNNWNTTPPINQNMWGIQVFEITEKEHLLVTQNIDKLEIPNTISSSNVSPILEDSYGMLWIGTTDKGLSKLDRKTGLFTNYSYDPADPKSISNNNIFALYEDKSGTLWIGTPTGLNKYIPKTDSFKKYTIKDGLPNNSIINILDDLKGNLWLATNNGISKFDPQDESRIGHLTFINYNIQDGLIYNNFINRSKYRAENGEMFFGGSNGFVSFFPGKGNPDPPHVLISDFRIFNQSVRAGEDSPLKKHISETKSITLPYDKNAFSFEFVALHFSRPEKNQYLYKMEGFDKGWLDGYRRYAPYTNLDPGKYVFRVKASNSDGIWNEEGVALNLTILPPWWRTIWAYSGYGLIFIGLIFGFDRFQRRKLLAKTKERMKIQEAEHRAEAAELEARVARAENERKTKELEEARTLQLSMLPKELPQLPNLDIAVYMQTATEVGGDYYDFYVDMDGTLTVVIGDATGHGMKAGTMVTATKSLFNSYAPNPDILFSFQEITRCIKQMNFGKLSMCLTMLKIKNNKIQMSSAGMPPSLIFRRDTRVVEEHLFKAMPLGTMDKFPYEIKDTTLNTGDTILLMSDGLPELKNSAGAMYGYKKIRNGFEDIAEKSPEEIINFLKNEGADWVDNADPDDDVTFVVIKVK